MTLTVAALLPLLPLLLLLALGGADPGPAGRRDHPTIAATTSSSSSEREGETVYLYTVFGENVTLSCSSMDSSKLTIRDYDDRRLRAKHIESTDTTVEVILQKPDVGYYRYYCADERTGCTAALRVQVLPAMTITPYVRRALHSRGSHVYFVPRGKDYNVVCSANEGESLAIYEMPSKAKLQATAVNETTVIAAVTDNTQGRNYRCQSTNLEKIVAQYITVIVDYPEAREFRCFSYGDRLECSWRSTTDANTFELFVLHKEGSTYLCSDSWHKAAGGCATALDDKWLRYADERNVTLQLQTCNQVFCSNQSFSINLRLVTKLNRIYDVKVVKTYPRGVVVAWRQDISSKFCTYKVEYSLLEAEWWQVNASSVSCDSFGIECELQLALPCARAHYKLRVYVRRKEATDDNRLWSEPAFTFFFTAPNRGDGVENPVCYRPAGTGTNHYCRVGFQ